MSADTSTSCRKLPTTVEFPESHRCSDRPFPRPTRIRHASRTNGETLRALLQVPGYFTHRTTLQPAEWRDEDLNLWLPGQFQPLRLPHVSSDDGGYRRETRNHFDMQNDLNILLLPSRG